MFVNIYLLIGFVSFFFVFWLQVIAILVTSFLTSKVRSHNKHKVKVFPKVLLTLITIKLIVSFGNQYLLIHTSCVKIADT
jgi:hypothetical protein